MKNVFPLESSKMSNLEIIHSYGFSKGQGPHVPCKLQTVINFFSFCKVPAKMRILELTSVLVPLYQRKCRCILHWKKKKEEERVSKAGAPGKQQAMQEKNVFRVYYWVLQYIHSYSKYAVLELTHRTQYTLIIALNASISLDNVKTVDTNWMTGVGGRQGEEGIHSLTLCGIGEGSGEERNQEILSLVEEAK